MPIITVNVVTMDHPIYIMRDGERVVVDYSEAGHMWINLPGDRDYGYGPDGPITNDSSVTRDSDTYMPGYYQHRIEVTQDQIDAMMELFDHYDRFGFIPEDHDVASNSCVDFVWKALELAGLNEWGFEGAMFPGNNIEFLKSLIPHAPPPVTEPPPPVTPAPPIVLEVMVMKIKMNWLVETEPI